jgi:hypothetical protein
MSFSSASSSFDRLAKLLTKLSGFARKRMSTPSPMDLPAKPTEPGDRFCDAFVIGTDHGTQILGIGRRRARPLAELARSPWVSVMPLRQLRLCQVHGSPGVSSANDHRTHRGADWSNHGARTIVITIGKGLSGRSRTLLSEFVAIEAPLCCSPTHSALCVPSCHASAGQFGCGHCIPRVCGPTDGPTITIRP